MFKFPTGIEQFISLTVHVGLWDITTTHPNFDAVIEYLEQQDEIEEEIRMFSVAEVTSMDLRGVEIDWDSGAKEQYPAA